MTDSDNRQWGVWALIVGSVLIVLCLVCCVIAIAILGLGLFAVPVSQPAPIPTQF